MNAILSNELDQSIFLALIRQVTQAVPDGQSETSVTTVVSRPMWHAWCRGTGMGENSEPTAWIGNPNTQRIYGSETVVVESEKFFAISFAGKYRV